ncbi:Elongation factor Ts [Emticicia aquatica]|jgi:elongation factor Ts|uniref:Elongation factor Ts n=1 Tax=Emticicia aquatica TaxID=1681835 RepID=A0ABM9ARG5_9BACT|nr:translation elongation factor Ts [Emticicia aquatica]CAH0996529.1 Elongation factor Ts [Emticicia aquatica]
MNITAADVNKLRQMTGAGMMDCKKALTEAEGDFEKAVEVLRKAGQKVAAKRADNETNEGLVLIDVSDSGKSAKIIALACETEPVSKVEVFRTLAEEILQVGVKHHTKDAATLMTQSMADGRTVEEAILELVGKIGEKIVITDFQHVEAEQVVAYNHSTGKLGVLVAFDNTQGNDVTEVGKDIAMQIAAMKPVGLDKDDVDPAIVQKEIEIGMEVARQEGKPDAMLEKIAMGKLGKFYKESTLLNQEFVKDNSLTIAQLLEKTQKGLKVTAFKRVQI